MLKWLILNSKRALNALSMHFMKCIQKDKKFLKFLFISIVPLNTHHAIMWKEFCLAVVIHWLHNMLSCRAWPNLCYVQLSDKRVWFYYLLFILNISLNEIMIFSNFLAVEEYVYDNDNYYSIFVATNFVNSISETSASKRY